MTNDGAAGGSSTSRHAAPVVVSSSSSSSSQRQPAQPTGGGSQGSGLGTLLNGAALTTTTTATATRNPGYPDPRETTSCSAPTTAPRHHLTWQATDQNSFIRPLVALCQEIIQRGGDDLGKGENRYLSPEVISLISRLRDFAQARIDTHPYRTDNDDNHNNDGGGSGSGSRTTWESEVASRHRLETLVGLKETLAVGNPFALIGIAAFAFFEVCDSGFGQWQRHLLGAKSLLDCHCTRREDLDALSRDVTGLTAIISRLVWFDTLGAIGRGTSDMIFDPWHRDLLDHDFFRTIGCPADAFSLFARVAAGHALTDPSGLVLSAMDQLLNLEQGESDWDLSANIYRCAAVLAVLTRTKTAQDDAAAARGSKPNVVSPAASMTSPPISPLSPLSSSSSSAFHRSSQRARPSGYLLTPA